MVAADIFDGLAIYQPTQGELAWLCDISIGLIKRARQLPPEQRQAVAEGRAALPPARRRALSMPNPEAIDDTTLINFVRSVGPSRVLDAAIAAEAAQ